MVDQGTVSGKNMLPSFEKCILFWELIQNCQRPRTLKDMDQNFGNENIQTIAKEVIWNLRITAMHLLW